MKNNGCNLFTVLRALLASFRHVPSLLTDQVQQVTTIRGIEEDNVVDVSVTTKNVSVSITINNIQQVQNPPVADQHVHEPLESSQSSQIGLLKRGVDSQCMRFKLRLRGLPVTVLVAGTVCAGYGLGVCALSTVAQIVEVVAPLATQVILKVVSGSLFIHVLTQGNQAKQVLLHDLSSNRLLRVVQEITEQANLKVEAINLVGVAAVIITQQEFNKLKRTSTKKLKRLRSLDVDSLQTITSHHSILQNQARTLSIDIPPEEEKEYIDCLKRNEEFCKGVKSENLNRRHSRHELKVTVKTGRTDISSKSMHRSSIQIYSPPQLQRDSATSLPQSVQKAEQSKFSKKGFLRNHPKFSEFKQVSMLHHELQKWIAAHLKDLKNMMWIGSKQSIGVQIKNLSQLPTKYFAGDLEKVLRDALRIYTALCVMQFRSVYCNDLMSFMLDLIKSWSDVSLNRRFLKFYCYGLTKLLHCETYHFANNWNLSRLLYTVLSMMRNYQNRHPSILLQAYSTYFQKVSDDKVLGMLWADPQGMLDLVLKIASSSEVNSTKIFTNECRQLIKQPAVTLSLKSVHKALELAEVLREKSKFGLSLQMARWCESLIADLENGESESRFPTTMFSRYKRRMTFKRSSRTNMKENASVSSEIYQLLCCFHLLLHILQRVVSSWGDRYGMERWLEIRSVYYEMSIHLVQCEHKLKSFPPGSFIPLSVEEVDKVDEDVDELKKLLFISHFELEQFIDEVQSEVKASGSALEALAEEILQARLAGSRMHALLREVSRLLDRSSKPGEHPPLQFVSTSSLRSMTNSVYKKPTSVIRSGIKPLYETSTLTSFEPKHVYEPLLNEFGTSSTIPREITELYQKVSICLPTFRLRKTEDVVTSYKQPVSFDNREIDNAMNILETFQLDWPKENISACEYLLAKLEALNNLVYATMQEWLSGEYGLQETVLRLAVPVLQNISLTVQELHCTQPSEINLQRKVSFSNLINLADLLYYCRQYNEVLKTLDSLLLMMRISEDCFDSCEVGCCLHLRAIAKQSLGLYEQASADCAEAISCYRRMSDAADDDDERSKQLNAMKNLQNELQTAVESVAETAEIF